MNTKSFDHFSFELRQFRISSALSRAAFASILGISPSTLREWEDGTARPRTYKLWEVYDRLKIFVDQDKSRGLEADYLLSIFDELIENLKLANIDEREQKFREVDKKLTRTILKAAQTDFGLSKDRRLIVPIPFTEDLELFRSNRILDIEQLLQAIVANINDTIPHIQKANFNEVRLLEAFSIYRTEAERDFPNPRILHRKGEIIRRQVQDSEIRQAVSSWDVHALDGFVSDHQELMRLYFGEALLSAQEVEQASISDSVIDQAGTLASQAIAATESIASGVAENGLRVDPRIPAILKEIDYEIDDYLNARRSANTPAVRVQAENRIKNSVKHIGIFIGRFILRSITIGYKIATNATAILAAIETFSPGSFRAIYETIRIAFPALPPLP